MYYIGIGASAGGQQALCEFFDHLDAVTGAAYFVTTHLTRSYRSRLDEIIQRHTPMRVIRVTEQLLIESNQVYVQPENAYLFFDKAFVNIKKRPVAETINRAVNLSLTSMALNHAPYTIGIILSGAGEDGTNGIVAIAQNGGKVFVQDPASAASAGMPISAIANDHPLAVLRPSDLALKINEMMARPALPSS